MSQYTDLARGILERNDKGGYTVPTARLYPFQWNWDSAFVSMGFATFNVERAYRELERLVEGQWEDGMIPHIVFHAPSDTYFPGPEVWGTRHRIPTSGITQPPVFGMALRHIFESSSTDVQKSFYTRTIALLQAALKWHEWWLKARDPENRGIVSLLHPWESGSDNSPAWDAALERVPTTTVTEIRRKDTGHVDASMRPRDVDYKRFIHLVDTYRACEWKSDRQWAAAPFKVADIQTTAILLRSTRDLIHLTSVLPLPSKESEKILRTMEEHLTKGLESCWREKLSRFVSVDLISGADIEVITQATFIPLVGLRLGDHQKECVVKDLEKVCGGVVLGIPTTPLTSPLFEPKRYWRGPVWAVINWLIADGLRFNNVEKKARELEQQTVHAMEKNGFCEYFDPTTGAGLGGDQFSWTAATYLVMNKRLQKEL